jgi:hypothetical protein
MSARLPPIPFMKRWLFRENDWNREVGGGQTTISVVVRQPEVEHKVRVRGGGSRRKGGHLPRRASKAAARTSRARTWCDVGADENQNR